MYYTVVAALMFVFPLASIGIDSLAGGATMDAALVAKWFAFWSVGWRLVLAGTRQILQPAYTARTILGLSNEEPTSSGSLMHSLLPCAALASRLPFRSRE